VTVFILATLLCAVTLLPAWAQEDQDRQKRGEALHVMRLHGWVVDDGTGSRHANAESKDAVLASHEEGVPLVFVAEDGTTYLIVDQEGAIERVGQAWDVIATLRPNGNLNIGSYIQPKKKQTPGETPPASN
jgi:hypothetical protein